MGRNQVTVSVHLHDPAGWEFAQLDDVLVVRTIDATLFFSPEEALDFARRLFDFAEPLANAAELAVMTEGLLHFVEKEGKNGEPMMVCSECGNGNIVNYPDSWHCYHYKHRGSLIGPAEVQTNDF